MRARKNLRVLILEPANRQLSFEGAQTNGSLGPAYLVGALRERGIEAHYLDATVGRKVEELSSTFFNRFEADDGTVSYGMSQNRLAEELARYDVVATSSIFSVQTRMHFEVAALARRVACERGRPMLLVSGGVNARALYRHFIGAGFDVVALGEGERTIVEVVEAFSSGAPDFSSIDGIAFAHQGGVAVRPVQRRSTGQSLDLLPSPELSALPLDIYRELRIARGGLPAAKMEFAPIQTSRGCQDRCTFCHISLEKVQTDLVGQIGFLRAFSEERVGADVQRAVDLGLDHLYFEDDNLFFSKRRLRALAPHLQKPGLTYSNMNGANVRFLLRKEGSGGFTVDHEFIETLANFGLRELMLPFESRNVGIMKRYASGKYDPDSMDSLAIVRALRRAGITTRGNFMIGFRDEPWESILSTKEFARQLRAEGLDSVSFMIPVPFPGSVDFEDATRDAAVREDFERDPLKYTDHMRPLGRPLFKTDVAPERLEAAVRDFWLELNAASHTAERSRVNLVNPGDRPPFAPLVGS